MLEAEIARAKDEDADAVAALIQRTITVSNAADYPDGLVERIAAGFTTERVRSRIVDHFVLVAKLGETIVGTGSLVAGSMRSLFVEPTLQGKGIGSLLCDAIEDRAREDGILTLGLQSSLTARVFYQHRGYDLLGESLDGGEPIVLMRKRLDEARDSHDE